eukprot:3358071-Karenia_brevis.AAC.1
MKICTDGSGGIHSGEPRPRRCGWAWVVNSANGGMGYAPVGYHGEYGTLDGRQTVPRSELTAVMSFFSSRTPWPGGPFCHHVVGQQD